MSFTNSNDQSLPISSTAGQDPAIEALVEQLVASRLQETARQVEVWKLQEAQMQKQEASLLKAIEDLTYKLTAAESQATTAQQNQQ